MSDKAEQVIAVRLTVEQVNQIDALARRIPGAKRSAVARDLLARALDDVRKNPEVLIAPEVPPKEAA